MTAFSFIAIFAVVHLIYFNYYIDRMWKGHNSSSDALTGSLAGVFIGLTGAWLLSMLPFTIRPWFFGMGFLGIGFFNGYRFRTLFVTDDRTKKITFTAITLAIVFFGAYFLVAMGWKFTHMENYSFFGQDLKMTNYVSFPIIAVFYMVACLAGTGLRYKLAGVVALQQDAESTLRVQAVVEQKLEEQIRDKKTAAVDPSVVPARRVEEDSPSLTELNPYGTLKLENKAGLSDQELDLLKLEFRPLRLIEINWPVRVLRYVVDGDDEEILELFTGRQVASRLALGKVGDQYLLQSFNKNGTYPRGDLFDSFTTQDPGVLLRLGKIYAAATMKSSDYPTWCIALLDEATKSHFQSLNGLAPIPSKITAPLMEEIIRADGLTKETLIETLLTDSDESVCSQLMDLADLKSQILKYQEQVKNALTGTKDMKVQRALEILCTLQVPLMPFAAELVAAALSEEEQTKTLARSLVLTMPNEALPLIEQNLAAKAPETRSKAAILLGFIQTETAKNALQARLATEEDESVREIITEAIWLSQASATDFDMQPLAQEDSVATLTWEAFDLLKAFVHRFNTRVTESQAMSDSEPEFAKLPMRKVSPVVATQAFQFLQAKDESAGNKPPEGFYAHYSKDTFDRLDPESTTQLQALMAMPDFHAVHLLRLLILVHTININDGQKGRWFHMTQEAESLIRHYQMFKSPDFGMRKMAAMLQDFGWDTDCLVAWQFDLGPNQHGAQWEDDSVWPYFAERLDILKQALALKRSSLFPVADLPKTQAIALEVLKAFPAPPRDFLPVLWDLALGDNEALRPLAQAALDKHPDTKDRVKLKCNSAIGSLRQVAMKWEE